MIVDFNNFFTPKMVNRVPVRMPIKKGRTCVRPKFTVLADFSIRTVKAVGQVATCFFIQAVGTDLGRSIGYPMARATIIWAHKPMVRETENSTV